MEKGGRVKQYGVILADPPWRYRDIAPSRAVENHYPTMPIEDICALPVGEFARPDTVLLLWATNPKLVEALRVVEAWGFEYVTAMPWVKVDHPPQVNFWGEWQFRPQFGMGWWVRGCAELILIAKRGKAHPPAASFVGLLSPNYEHSRKPDNLYHYAEALPGPYLELFARRRRNGWDAWGNEVASDVEVAA